jgi:ketosteroid isomerase-like protein
MKKLIVLSLLVLGMIVLAGCGSGRGDDITSVIYDNLKAYQDENLNAVMATIHEQSPLYADTRTITEQIFNLYDLKYKLESVRVIEESDEEARVRAVQITEKISGPDFRDNKIVAIHVLKKAADGEWKIYSSEIESIDYLD